MSIVDNKKAFFDYSIEDRFEAGIMLEGWEVKAIRSKKISIQESYVIFKDGTFHLFGAHITPLSLVDRNYIIEPLRTRKLLLNQKEIDKLSGKVQRAGYTVVPLNLHFNKGRIKLEIGLAKGKKQYDKRATEKDRDVQRDIQRIVRHG
jgi:SsrA-binding protein